jgi:hypothetical protein
MVNVLRLFSSSMNKPNKLACLQGKLLVLPANITLERLASMGGSGLHLSGLGRVWVETIGLGLFQALVK